MKSKSVKIGHVRFSPAFYSPMYKEYKEYKKKITKENTFSHFINVKNKIV